MKISRLILIKILIYVLFFGEKCYLWSLLVVVFNNNIILRKLEKVYIFICKSVNYLFFIIKNVSVLMFNFSWKNLIGNFYLDYVKY